jgi:hypothetical protein
MARRTLRVSWVLALSAAVSLGCASGSTDEEVPVGGDSDITDGFVDDTSGADGTVDDSSIDSGGGGDGTTDGSGDGSGDGATDGGGDASCDPEAGLTISCGVGECTVTVDACSEAGVPQTCKPKDPTPEVCDGKDNNCDGKVDEDLGETTCGMGECVRTQKNCVDGAPQTCTAGTPGTETCNGKDDDCNGLVDDGFGTITCGVGECQVTVNKCETGSVFHPDCSSVTTKTPTAEVCNGKDDNCNGTADEGLGTTTCGVGECQRTVPNFMAGSPVACVPGTPLAETCNGKDDDCNGVADDLPAISCGVGACVNTVPACAGGAPNTCTPKSPTAETCNGIDDNCNGTPDDGLGVKNCGIGECKNTVAACVGGVDQTCTPLPSSPEICDGKDNDCSGAADDGAPATMCPPPSHTATTVCTMGACKTAGCSTGYVDVNGSFSDGCECLDSALPHSCGSAAGSATDMGNIAVGANNSSTPANNPVTTNSDWYKVTFLNTKTDKLAHPKISFVTNPGDSFRLEVVLGSCGGSVPACGSEGGTTATNQAVWETSYLSSATGDPTDPAWTPIASGSYTPAAATYASVWVRVFYKTGAVATCSPYQLKFQN